jgi:hypothetical protein
MAKYTTDGRHDGKQVGGEICGVFGSFSQKELAALYAIGHPFVIKSDDLPTKKIKHEEEAPVQQPTSDHHHPADGSGLD